jgi:hypothetical protein
VQHTELDLAAYFTQTVEDIAAHLDGEPIRVLTPQR